MSDVPPRGPAPLPRLEAGSRHRDTRLAVIRVLVDVEDPVSITEVSSRIGCHPNSARAHLDGLVHDGVAHRTLVQSGGRGRPHYRYAAAPGADAALRAVESSDLVLDEYRGLVAAFAAVLRSSSPGLTRATARDVGRAWAGALPGPSSRVRPAAWVVDLLARLGFSPRPGVGPEPESDLGAAVAEPVIELRTCPLLDVATEFPDVVCQVHHGLIEAAHGAAGGSGEVRLVAFAAPGACHVHLPDVPRGDGSKAGPSRT